MKKALTLIELIFVIIIIGILSVAIMPSFQRDTLQEAANQIVSHIRYTQHLAMMDNKFNPTQAKWFAKRWQLDFKDNASGVYYTIFQDLDGSGSPSTVASKNEIARNPENNKRLLTSLGTNEKIKTKSLDLRETYGISSITFSSSCRYYGSQMISFDYLGRPLYGKPKSLDTSYRDNNGPTGIRLIRNQCVITFANDSDSIQIAIEPETGYAHILRP